MVRFNFKTKIKGFLKKLDSDRKDRYIACLCTRINKYRRLLKSDVANGLSEWPLYISDKIIDDIEIWYNAFLDERVYYIVHRDAERMKRLYKRAISSIEQWYSHLVTIKYYLNHEYPKLKKEIGPIDYSHIKYVVVTNVWGKKYYGMIYDNHPQVGLVLGRFFDKNGELYQFQNEIDDSYLIQPMDDENDFKRYFNNCSKLFINSNNTSTEMINEYNQLNDYWAVQQTYLKLKNEKK